MSGRKAKTDDGYTRTPLAVARELRRAARIVDFLPDPETLKREIKRPVSLRLDSDVLMWFQAVGPGYQTRINAVLRAYMMAKDAHPDKA